MHLEVDIRILQCDFVMCGGFFSLFLISAKNMCWEWRWKSLKNTWLDTGLAYRGPVPIIGTFETISVSSCSSRGLCQRASASRHLRMTLSLYWHWVGGSRTVLFTSSNLLGEEQQRRDKSWNDRLIFTSLYDGNRKRGLRMSFDSGSSLCLPCPHSVLSNRETRLFLYSRLVSIAPLPEKAAYGERHMGPWEKQDQARGQPLSQTNTFLCSPFHPGDIPRWHSTYCVVLWLTAVLWTAPGM